MAQSLGPSLGLPDIQVHFREMDLCNFSVVSLECTLEKSPESGVRLPDGNFVCKRDNDHCEDAPHFIIASKGYRLDVIISLISIELTRPACND